MAEETSSDIAAQYRLPSATTLQHVVKISITEDKPIMLDYWTGSLGGGPRPVIFLVEYANIIDADNTGINNETIMKAWPGEDERREFFQKRNKYIDWGHKDIGLYVNRVKWNKR